VQRGSGLRGSREVVRRKEIKERKAERGIQNGGARGRSKASL
jgi:hypothetical protein